MSQLVIQEASFGNATAAAARLQVVGGIPLLQLTEEGKQLAERLVSKGAIPQKVVVPVFSPNQAGERRLYTVANLYAATEARFSASTLESYPD